VSESSTLPLGNGSRTTSPMATAASTHAMSLRRRRVCIRLDISLTVPARVLRGRNVRRRHPPRRSRANRSAVHTWGGRTIDGQTRHASGYRRQVTARSDLQVCQQARRGAHLAASLQVTISRPPSIRSAHPIGTDKPSEQGHPKGLHCCESDGLHRRPVWLVDLGALTLMRISEIQRSPLRDLVPRSKPTRVHRSSSS
jgi:hypothetical protein